MKTVKLGTRNGKELNVNCLVYEPDDLYHSQWADKLKVGSHMLNMASSNPYLFFRTYIERKAPMPEHKPEYDIGHAVESLLSGWPERVVCSDFQTRCKGHYQVAKEQPHNTVLTVPDYELCHHLALEIQGHDGVKNVMREGSAQIAARIDLPKFYLQGKYDWYIRKPDIVQRDFFATDGPVIVDFKTCARLRDGYGNFFHQLKHFGYIEQAALYQILHKEIVGTTPKWYWVVVEKEWPRECTIVEADDETMLEARRSCIKNIDRLRERFSNDFWENTTGLIEPMYPEEK